MTRTISVTTNPATGFPDLDGTVVDDLESLKQRVVQAIKFVFGSWFLNQERGLRYDLIRGHQTSLEIAARTITETIREEGGSEITSIETPIVTLDVATRSMTYHARVQTIYGVMSLTQDV